MRTVLLLVLEDVLVRGDVAVAMVFLIWCFWVGGGAASGFGIGMAGGFAARRFWFSTIEGDWKCSGSGIRALKSIFILPLISREMLTLGLKTISVRSS